DLSAQEPTIDPFGVCPGSPGDAGGPPIGPVDAGAVDAGAGVDGRAPAAAAADPTTADDAGAGPANRAPDGGAPPSTLAGGDAGFALTVEPLSSPSPLSMVLRDDAP